MFVLALDPGKTTGFAVFSPPSIAYHQREFSPRQFWYFLTHQLDPIVDKYVICESFEFRQGKQLGVDLYPCELIGIVKLYMTIDVDFSNSLFFQSASVQGKKSAYFTDQLLKDMGLYLRGVEHGRSAVKHLLHWLQFGSGSQFGIDLDELQLTDLLGVYEKYEGG